MKHLYHICDHHNLAPGAMQIELVNNPTSIVPYCGGGFGEVFRYTNQGLEIAIKVLKIPSDRDLRKMSSVSPSRFSLRLHVPVHLPQPIQRYYKEAITWKFLKHPNVLPLLGVPKNSLWSRFAMVSEWMTNGTIVQFVKARVDVNRFELVRCLGLVCCTHRSEPCGFCSWRVRPRD